MNTLIIICAKYLVILSIVSFLYAGYKLNRKERKVFFILSICSLPIAYIVAKILGHIFHDPRPFVVEHISPLISHAADNGFPSDHTLLTMTLAAIVFQFNKKYGDVMAVISLIIGISRVAAHVHHTVDIFGAALIGIITVYIVSTIYKRKFHAESHPHSE